MKKSNEQSHKSNLPARRNTSAPALSEYIDLTEKNTSAEKKPKTAERPAEPRVRNTVQHTAPAKKKPVVPIIAAVAGVIVVAGVVLGVLYFKNPQDNPLEKAFEAQIDVVMADGTTQTMNANAAYAELATDKFYAGTVIDGVDVGGMTKQEAYDAVMKVLPENPVTVDVKLDLVGKVLKPDFKDITIEYNTADVIEEAFAKYRPSDKSDLSNLAECYNEVQKLKTENMTFESTYTVKIGDVHNVVSNLLSIYVEEYAVVKDATITDFDTETCEFVVDKEKKGYDINIEGAVQAVEALFGSGKYSGTVTVPTVVKEPAVTEEMIRENFGLVGSEWTVTDGNDNRNANITQACNNINGTILEPGEVFSFNEVVGQRTADNGFTTATVIAGGEYKQDFGGGICQVSTTLYNAALKTNLKIVERHSHAWPSDYIAPGLDATVDWPSLDFKFENDTEFQIVIVTWWDPSDSTCNAQIYGQKLPDGQTIETRGEIVSATPAGDTEYIADPDMDVGQTRTLRNAHQGITAYAYKVWSDAEGNEISKDFYNSSYYGSYGARIAVGVRRSDGSIATLDYSTGEVIDPEPPTPTPTVTPTPNPDPPTPGPDTTTPTPDPPTPETPETPETPQTT